MTVNLDEVLGGVLGSHANLTIDEVEALLRRSTAEAGSNIETTFGGAGWYDRAGDPYEPPTVASGDPPPNGVRTVEAERRLWLTRYNPSDPAFDVPDINDDAKFPWQHPEAAPRDGWWLNTVSTPAGRAAIEEIASGDLVCQRSDPKKGGDDRFVGVCVIGMTDAWNDAHTGRRERRACLVPLAKFTHPVPRRTARNHHRVRGPSFKHPRQLPGRRGRLGFGLSVVDWDDAVELLSVCGIPPDALAEPDTGRLAARLRASDTGNELFLRLRYDAMLRDRVRRVHERLAERQAEAWAADHGYVKRDEFQRVPLAGFDLLFADGAGKLLQVEVKGYSSRNLATVHLQPSQAWRASDADGGKPPDWRLFALLGAGSKNATKEILQPGEVMNLLAGSGLQVKGGWPAPRPGSAG